MGLCRIVRKFSQPNRKQKRETMIEKRNTRNSITSIKNKKAHIPSFRTFHLYHSTFNISEETMSSFHDNPNQTRNQKSIQHLKSIKPFDGWSIDTFNDNKSNNANNNNTTTKKNDDELVMLKRRNIPLYNKQGFEFIYYDEDNTKCVYGITSYIGDTHDSLFCKAVVLVDEKGIVVRDLDQKNHISIKVKKNEGTKDVTMDMRKKNILRAKEGLKRRQNTTGSPTNQSSNTVIPNMSDEQTAEMARLGLIFIGGLTMLKMFATMFKSLNIVLFPLLVLYAMSTCPSNDSFDAKKELKRVMRGYV